MTQEEKARRYDEALEEAKKWHKTFVTGQNYPATDIKVSYEWIFPELKESDNERIRKAIICGMTALKVQGKKTFATIPIDDCIALLEKQGEEKSVEWSRDDETGLGDALWAIEQASTIAKDENDMGNLWYAEKWLKSLKQRI